VLVEFGGASDLFTYMAFAMLCATFPVFSFILMRVVELELRLGRESVESVRLSNW
jgi:hypothetical protein